MIGNAFFCKQSLKMAMVEIRELKHEIAVSYKVLIVDKLYVKAAQDLKATTTASICSGSSLSNRYALF